MGDAMKSATILLGTALLMFGAESLVAGAEDRHVHIPVVPARASDVSIIEATVNADYESISGGVGVARNWGRDLSLYDPNARSFEVFKNSKTGTLETWTPTLQEYADELDEHFVQTGFVERELHHKINRFGNMATVCSTSEGKFTSTGESDSRGVNILGHVGLGT
jgi:hypothetical protein